MKKLLSMILVFSLVIVLAACGGSNGDNVSSNSGGDNSSSSNTDNASSNNSSSNNATTNDEVVESEITGKIVFATHRTDMVGEEFVDYKKRFEEKYPGAEVEFQPLADYMKTLNIRMASGEYPDVIMTPKIASPDFPEFLEPLNDTVEELGDLYFKDFKAHEGKIYGIASGSGAFGVVYNKKSFEKAGITEIPTTLDAFYEASEKLKQAGMIPLASNFSDSWVLGYWLGPISKAVAQSADIGSQRVDTDTPYQMDNHYGQSLSIIRTMYEKGYLEKDINSTNWEQSKINVAKGDFAMFALGNWVINQVVDAGAPTEDIGFFPLPVDNSGKLRAEMGPDFFYSVNKNSDNIPTAKAFIKWMVEESGFADFAGLIPPLKSQTPKLPQMAELDSFNPVYVESVSGNPLSTAIHNRAQIDNGKMVQEFILADDPATVFDKYNAIWKDARAAETN